MNSSDRMTNEQVAKLALAIVATAEVLGQAITADAAELMADDLADYPAQAVGAALKACRKELTGKLTLASILQRVQAADGRPGKDEAWSIALSASDEYETVAMTEEIRLAMNASNPILNAGDKVGARMAFLSAYERLVQQARTEAKPANWSLSIGFDPQRRLEAVAQAERMGRITPAIAQEQRLSLGYDAPSENGKAIAGLITGTVAKPTEDVRQRLAALRDSLQADKRDKEQRRRESVIRATEDLDSRRKRALAALKRAQEKQA